MRDEQDIQITIAKYADMVRRICFVYLKNHFDVEDVFQEVFLKYALHTKEFDSHEHKKSWLIRVSINACKDTLKSFFRKKVSYLEDLVVEPSYIQEDSQEVLRAVLSLPEKYRLVIYMVYYEGYTVVELAKILGRKENTIYSWITRGKKQLKELLGGDFVATENKEGF